VEFVQIPFNYIDAESELVQAMQAYEVIRKHGKLAVFMEPVKGGGLSMVPAAVEQRLKEMDPLSEGEIKQFHEIVRLYKDAGPIGADLEKYRGLIYHGAPVTAILEAYNMCQLQPDPGFSDDNNYLKNTVAEEAHLDFFGELPEEKVVLADGTDVTEVVKGAEIWLIEHSF